MSMLQISIGWQRNGWRKSEKSAFHYRLMNNGKINQEGSRNYELVKRKVY